jgi:hypothetical protein
MVAALVVTVVAVAENAQSLLVASHVGGRLGSAEIANIIFARITRSLESNMVSMGMVAMSVVIQRLTRK